MMASTLGSIAARRVPTSSSTSKCTCGHGESFPRHPGLGWRPRTHHLGPLPAVGWPGGPGRGAQAPSSWVRQAWLRGMGSSTRSRSSAPAPARRLLALSRLLTPAWTRMPRWRSSRTTRCPVAPVAPTTNTLPGPAVPRQAAPHGAATGAAATSVATATFATATQAAPGTSRGQQQRRRQRQLDLLPLQTTHEQPATFSPAAAG